MFRTPAPDRNAEERFDARDNDCAAMEQNLANARSASEQERHVEVDQWRRPMHPGDRSEARRRLRSRDRLDVLLDQVEDDLCSGQRQPDRRKPRNW
jgi:hypothetical protein